MSANYASITLTIKFCYLIDRNAIIEVTGYKSNSLSFDALLRFTYMILDMLVVSKGFLDDFVSL